MNAIDQACCITGRATPESLALAESLLEQGWRVGILSDDVAPFALAVNEYGDAILTIESDGTELSEIDEAMERLFWHLGAPTVIAIVPRIGGPYRLDVDALAQRWPDAELRVLAPDTDELFFAVTPTA